MRIGFFVASIVVGIVSSTVDVVALGEEPFGTWSGGDGGCTVDSSDRVTITPQRIDFYEYSCVFSGGAQQSDSDWIMKGRCVSMNTSVRNSSSNSASTMATLSVDEGGRKLFYNERCPAAPTRSLWTHNGSVMYLIEEGSRRRIFYREPRTAMLEAGANPDSLLFEGTSDGTHIDGVAFVLLTLRPVSVQSFRNYQRRCH